MLIGLEKGADVKDKQNRFFKNVKKWFSLPQSLFFPVILSTGQDVALFFPHRLQNKSGHFLPNGSLYG